MIDNKYIISVAIVILIVLFNIYFANVVTGYDKRPNYPEYPIKPIIYPNNGLNDEEIAIVNEERKAEEGKYKEEYQMIQEKRDKLAFKRHIVLLIMGIVSIVISFLIPNIYIMNGIGIGGLITVVYAVGSYWQRYNDKIILVIITIGLLVLFFLATRMYNVFNIRK